MTPLTNIGIHAIAAYDRKSLLQSGVKVTGTQSGSHPVSITLSSDRQTVVIHPVQPFAFGETVHVEFSARLVGGTIVVDTFDFQTSRKMIFSAPPNSEVQESPLYSAAEQDTSHGRIPIMNVVVDDSATPGTIYFSNLGFSIIPDSSYLFTLNEHGAIIKQRLLPYNHAFDFKMQPNGLLTYFDWNAAKYYGMDTAWNIVDSFQVADGYLPDAHDLIVFPDGGYALLAVEQRSEDLHAAVVRGDSTAIVSGGVIQIFDKSRNQIFNWRGFDHYEITDAIHENLTEHIIDFEHANSLDFDSAGNIIMSNRHLCEVTKINGQTGDIMWRLGGAHSSFRLVGDSVWFSYQHSARLLPNGHLTLFDNSDFDSVEGAHEYFQHSRAVEYQLDTNAWTAQVVWQYHHTPETYGSAMGYVERLPNGNTLISWGADTLAITEVRPDNSTAFEMAMMYSNYSYRAIKYPAPMDTPVVHMAVGHGSNSQQPLRVDVDMNGAITIENPTFEDQHVSMVVADVLGREVSTVSDMVVSTSSRRTFHLNSQQWHSGTYFFVLRSKSVAISQEFELLN